MRRRNQEAPKIRCAIYTRKSTEEGLEQEFNTLDAQRESGEAYIASQQHEGWRCIEDHYDDGGFTGGNMERPALRRLFADIEAGKVDCVVVYKVDRLSRSLLDFAKMMEVFDRHNVSFVSVTQQFNTASSMGRLILNVLLSFAQFEREMISERTRDKIAAARRKGKWSGGMPVLGYDVVDTKLIVNELEAERVRQVFELYLDKLSLIDTANEMNRRGWRTKNWTTKKGLERGGMKFDKTRLHKLLTNVTYIGRVRYKEETHDGEHDAIVDSDLFQRTQAALTRNSQNGRRAQKKKNTALLKGLLRCSACGCAMAHSFTKKGNRRYRYYLCTAAQKRGWHVCPAPSLPAGEIEQFVVDEIKCIGRDSTLVASVVGQSRHQTEQATNRLAREKSLLVKQLNADDAELRRHVANADVQQMASIQERIGLAERRLNEMEKELFDRTKLDEHEICAALGDFDAVWNALTARERVRLLELLIERIDHDAESGNMSIVFRPTGIETLAAELASREECVA